jgi:magnesium chelatase subunit H
VREDFKADAVLHYGTHGALEFMPGKQAGMSGSCWPDRLIGDLPNFYLYASNNPSEGMIAKRRSAATLISYLTPPLAQAGLYRGLLDLKASIERWRGLEPNAVAERERLEDLIRTQAGELDLRAEGADLDVSGLANEVLELEYTLIPNGLHVVGAPLSDVERVEMMSAVAAAGHGRSVPRAALEAIVAGRPVETVMALADVKVDPKTDQDDRAFFKELIRVDGYLDGKYELDGILHALDGRYVRPAPGGDILRTTDILPTGRNLHGFDPFRIPSAYAMKDGARLADILLKRHMADGHPLPETVALVLWGTDNLKSEGGPIGQALALMGALPRFDSYGRLCGAALTPLAELGRPRVDVMMTLSGIFRDLLPLQTKLLAEAAFLAASADEPEAMNFVRAHALEHMKKHGCDLETASLRVFSNADNAYGSNVNLMIDAGTWESEDELADAYQKRKGFAYGRSGRPQKQAALMESVLSKVDLAYQNLESVELGVTTLDQYFDTLGGISRAVGRARGRSMPVYISDTTKGEGKVRTLGEQVALETRTRMLNPKWYEGMLAHGYEGVRQIEAHVTNTMGWSATTGQVAPWVYQQLSETFVLDRDMRERLAALNPTASAKMTNRLIEAHERNYWTPDPEVLAALREASEDLEDRIEGIGQTKIPA